MWTIQDTFTKFIFPFRIESRHRTLEGMCASLTNDTAAYGGASYLPSPLWVEAPFLLSELDNLLPYVKQYMRSPQNHRRLMVSSQLLARLSHMQTSRMQDDECGFRMTAIDLHLFYNGIAFLVMEIKPVEPRDTPITMAWLEDLNADLASLTQGKTIWQRQSGDLLDNGPMTLRALIDLVLSPICESATCYEPMVDSFLPVYGAILLSPTVPLEAKSHAAADEAFQDFVVGHGIVLRKTLPSRNRNRFSRQTLSDPLHNYMPYHNVVHTQSLEGGFVIAYDNGDGGGYFSGPSSKAMQSFRTNYFYMMLLTLHQRMSILIYTADAGLASGQPDHAPVLRSLREKIYDFTARCYFSQASFSEERDQLYRRWQRAFNIGQMYAELKEQVHDIEGYLAQLAREQELAAREQELRQESSRNRWIGLITLVLLPVSVVSGVIQASPIIGAWFRGDKAAALLWLSIVTVLLLAGIIAVSYVLRKRPTEKESKLRVPK